MAFSILVVGVSMELLIMYVLSYYSEVELVNFDSLND